MKRFIIVLILAITSPLTHATEKNGDYYREHPEEAKAKYDECMKLVADFASAGDINRMMQIAEDPECKAADSVMSMRRHSH